jgi:hypothetical protein
MTLSRTFPAAGRHWAFKTANFLVVFDAEPEEFEGTHMDADFAAFIEQKIADGSAQCFCAVIRVYWHDLLVAEEYISECVYADPKEFVQPYGYFPGMVMQAVRTARQKVNTMMASTALRWSFPGSDRIKYSWKELV